MGLDDDELWVVGGRGCKAGCQKSWQINTLKLMSRVGEPPKYCTCTLMRILLRLFGVRRLSATGYGFICGLWKSTTILSYHSGLPRFVVSCLSVKDVKYVGEGNVGR